MLVTRLRKLVRSGVPALALAVCVACGGSDNPPAPNPGTPGPGAETITGRERIGWAQQAQDAAQLAAMDFVVYVDGVRRALPGDTCNATGGGGYDCTAPLPSLTPGQHTLELASFVMSDSAVIESERSAALRVNLTAVAPPAAATVPSDATVVTSDGHRLLATVLATSLTDPSDLAIAADGRVFIAERAGRVRIADAVGVADGAALELDDVSATEDSGLMAIALHPDFARNGHLYLSYTTEGRDGTVVRLARFRERNGLLGEGATISRERMPSAQPHATARFGVDGMLYVGFAAGQDSRASQNPASALGKILRLNADGTTPRDNPRGSTVFSTGHRDPRALAWQSSTGALWAIDHDRDSGDELNTIVPGADYGWPSVRGSAAHARAVPPALVLPVGSDISAAGFVPAGSSSPLAGDLLLASKGSEDLLRLRVNSRPPSPAEGLLQRRYGRIAAMAVTADGTIFIATGNRETWGAGHDALIRITPLSN